MLLRRSMRDKKIAGVCGGMARSMGLSSTSVRWFFVLLVLLFGMSGWVYLVLWAIIPSDEDHGEYKE
ncbi:MAG TPA: PspC domain-containing protein [Spirochaetales bacterium]|nr:PspC domain-containing protein [Spirochaetales bacterium]HPG87441.1 PspC domain-containing protein [Spirochaetales bacterium]HPM73147.1 PspC domain-containing protein [Spirochaetales bacterium]